MNKNISPWRWIPSLYVAEAIPYVAVNTLTVLMYTQMGIGLKEMAFFTGWLYLPWVIKPFWSPFVDIISTKRKWILMMQVLIAIGFASVAYFLSTSFFFASTLAVFWAIAFFSATHDIAADGYYMLALSEHQQAAFVGVRSTFYRLGTLFGQGGLIWIAAQVEKHLSASGSPAAIVNAWRSVFVAVSLIFLCIAICHVFALPGGFAQQPEQKKGGNVISEFFRTFIQFFTKPHIVSALAFMLLFRLPEALCIKILQPFFISPRIEGGLGMSLDQVAVASGITGVVALLAGGIAGGIAISRKGLRYWLFPMAATLTLPCAFYLLMAMFPPAASGTGFAVINAAVFVEQFGYGFGFTAFMLYLIYFSEGERKTSYYAFCTAFMALGMMIPGMFSGWLFEVTSQWNILMPDGAQGYVNFFLWVMLSSVVTFAVCGFLKIDPRFGMKK